MRALRLVNQLWVIVQVNSRKNRASSELLYKGNRAQLSMSCRLISHFGMLVGRSKMRLVVYKFLSCSTNISRGLSAYK